MTYVERIRRALDYLEAHLGEATSLDEAARVACCSRFHFFRVFRALTGESPAGYVRARRLAEAGRDLMRGQAILETALAWGFESQASFTRAFRRQFGVTPGQCRRTGRLEGPIQKRPLDREQLDHLQGGMQMKPTFRTLPAFTVVGLSGRFDGSTKAEIPALWDRFLPRTAEVRGALPGRCFGVCDHPEGEDGGTQFRYTAAVEVSAFADESPKGMSRVEVQGATYAVFRHLGPPATISRTYDHVYGTWLPRSGYELDGRHDFEHYGAEFDARNPESATSVIEVFVPVRRKGEARA